MKTDKREIKINLLADDITLNFLERDSVKDTMKVLKCFSWCVGLKLMLK